MVCDGFHDEPEYGFDGREYTHRRLALEYKKGIGIAEPNMPVIDYLSLAYRSFKRVFCLLLPANPASRHLSSDKKRYVN
jgi:hypothetical protein